MGRVADHFDQTRFVMVTTNRELSKYGAPVDVVPTRWTALGMMSHGEITGRPRYQDAFACCGRSLWQPMADASKRLGATTIIRGQRAGDRQKAPLTDGDVVDGITYRFPIENWTRERVIEFVKAEAPLLIPESYREGEKTSRDCWDCTAYLVDNRRRIDNLSVEQYRDVAETLAHWRQDVKNEMEQTL
jgi:3'-phosphoadenosine 5'-phosphosulfate sulfotransferase (PAPS reductase)/FAD synthetase